MSSHPSSSSSERHVGWHFEPREDEMKYFLEEKNKNPAFSAPPIVTCNIYEFNPDELASKFPAEWKNMYFFTQLNLINDGGSRANRQAKDGFWVHKNAENSIGYKKSTLNFHKGVKSKGKNTNCIDHEQPEPVKTDWLMKEYRLDEVEPPTMKTTTKAGRKGKRVAETRDDNPKKMEEFVLCQIYKKSKAKKTNEAVIMNEHTSFFTPDQSNIIPNECLSATHGRQIYSQVHITDLSWEDISTNSEHFDPHLNFDQSNINNGCLSATPGVQICSQGGTHTGIAWGDYITPDQTNNISNECPSATPGMQIYSQGGTHTGIALEDYITPDQTNDISNECLSATPGMQIYSQKDITDLSWNDIFACSGRIDLTK